MELVLGQVKSIVHGRIGTQDTVIEFESPIALAKFYLG